MSSTPAVVSPASGAGESSSSSSVVGVLVADRRLVGRAGGLDGLGLVGGRRLGGLGDLGLGLGGLWLGGLRLGGRRLAALLADDRGDQVGLAHRAKTLEAQFRGDGVKVGERAFFQLGTAEDGHGAVLLY